MELKAELAGAETKLNSIHEFKLFRMQDEKAQQVADQTLIIERLNAKIAELKQRLKN
jgi:hypothetical protein